MKQSQWVGYHRRKIQALQSKVNHYRQLSERETNVKKQTKLIKQWSAAVDRLLRAETDMMKQVREKIPVR